MIPWFCVVANPVQEGSGIPHPEKRTGIEPWT